MKQHWIKLAGRLDAMNLRERTLIFLMAAAVLVALANSLLLDPLRQKESRLAQQLKQDQDGIAAIHVQVQNLAQGRGNDPAAVNRNRRETLQQEIGQADEALKAMRKSLVQPDRMTALLEDILQREGQLQLVSLKTLPVGGVLDGAAAKDKPGQEAKPEAKKEIAGQVYKHGVELVVRGNYADLQRYLARLEGLPWQMFWGQAELKAEEYPQSVLTLTLYTLSLDKTWLNI